MPSPRNGSSRTRRPSLKPMSWTSRVLQGKRFAQASWELISLQHPHSSRARYHREGCYRVDSVDDQRQAQELRRDLGLLRTHYAKRFVDELTKSSQKRAAIAEQVVSSSSAATSCLILDRSIACLKSSSTRDCNAPRRLTRNSQRLASLYASIESK
jgi:hypothetical protein